MPDTTDSDQATPRFSPPGRYPISGTLAEVLGLGIDRFVALATGAPTLRDVVLFPLLREAAPTGGEAVADGGGPVIADAD